MVPCSMWGACSPLPSAVIAEVPARPASLLGTQGYREGCAVRGPCQLEMSK